MSYLRKQFASVSIPSIPVVAVQILQSLLVVMLNTDGSTFASKGLLDDGWISAGDRHLSCSWAYLTVLEELVLKVIATEKDRYTSRATTAKQVKWKSIRLLVISGLSPPSEINSLWRIDATMSLLGKGHLCDAQLPTRSIVAVNSRQAFTAEKAIVAN